MRGQARWVFVLIFLFLAFLTVVPPVGASGCTPSPAVGLYHPEDGDWWVAVDRYKGGEVYHLSDEYGVVSSNSIQVPNSTYGGQILDIHRNQSGYWYVLTPKRIVTYSKNWESLNRSRQLSSKSKFNRRYGTHGGLTQDKNGNLWVANDRTLQKYTSDLEPVAESDISSRSVLVQEQSVLVLQQNSISSVENINENPTTRNLWSPDWETGDPVDFYRIESGYWHVLGGDGRIYEYTPYGQYTGHSIHLPVDAENCSNGGRLLFPLLVFVFIPIWVIAPIVLSVFFRANRIKEILGTAAFGIIAPLTFYSHLFPWPFSTVFWLPDIVLGSMLLTSVALLLSRFVSDRTLLILFGLILLPLAIVAIAYSPWSILIVALGIFYFRLRRRNGPIAPSGFPIMNRQ